MTRRLPRFNEGILILLHLWEIADSFYPRDKASLSKLASAIISTACLTRVGRPTTRTLSNGGMYFFQALAESHLCIETWPEDSALVFELYSCRMIDPQQVLSSLRKELNPRKWNAGTLGGWNGFFQLTEFSKGG